MRASILLIAILKLCINSLKSNNYTKNVIIKVDPVHWLYKISTRVELYKNQYYVGTNFLIYNLDAFLS